MSLAATIAWINANNIGTFSTGANISELFVQANTNTSLGIVSVDLTVLPLLWRIDLPNVGISAFLSILPTTVREINLINNKLTSFRSNLPSSLQSLVLTNNRLSSFTMNIPFPDNLYKLDIGGNIISSFSRSLPPTLTYLDISNNLLTSYSLPTNLTNLKYLDLGGNQLPSFTSTLPSSLLYLDISNNKLPSYTRSLPPNLQYLSIAGNQLPSFTQSLPPSLLHLDIGNNQLPSYTQSLPPNLQYLGIYMNQLTSFTQDLPPSLLQLDISNNQLASFTQVLPPNLQYLNILTNNLSSFTQSLPTTLVYLNIASNSIASFTQDLSVNNAMNEFYLCLQRNVTPTFTYPLPTRFVAVNTCYVAPNPPPPAGLPPLPCYCDSDVIQSYIDAHNNGNLSVHGFPTIYSELQLENAPGTVDPDANLVFIASIMFQKVFSHLLDMSEDLIYHDVWPMQFAKHPDLTIPPYTNILSLTDLGAIFKSTYAHFFWGEPGLPTVWDPSGNYELPFYDFWKLWEGVTDQQAIDFAAGYTSTPPAAPGVHYMTAANQAIANAVTGTTYRWAILLG